MNSNLEPLQSLGLSEDQIHIYSLLLSTGPTLGKIIVLNSTLKKGLVYKVLDQLIERGLVEKKDRGTKAAIFLPAHPGKMKELLQKKKDEMLENEAILSPLIQSLTSQYNLVSGKPNIQFFEGKEAVRVITNDFPTQEKEIRQWIDVEKILDTFDKEARGHLQERIKKNISKKMIVANNQKSIEYTKLNPPLTEFKIDKNSPNFPSAIQIYDGKITILNISKEYTIGLIIQDPTIATMMKIVFDSAWTQAENIISSQENE